MRLKWFLVGAVTASLFWLAVLRLVDQQLFSAFFGLTGH
jgi:hypothetical protein